MTLEQNYSHNAGTGFIETDQFVLDLKPVFFLDNDALDSGSGGYDPALEAYVGAIDTRVEDNSDAIKGNLSRIQALESGGGGGGGLTRTLNRGVLLSKGLNLAELRYKPSNLRS